VHQIMLRVNPSDEVWFRSLTPRGQHLYMLLERSRELSHAGVMAWWPGRVAMWAQDWTAAEVSEAVEELVNAKLVEIDLEAGELWLVRRIEDGLCARSPKLRPAVARAIAAICSPRLRAAAIGVLRRLVAVNPAGWAHPDVMAVLPLDTLPDTPSDTLPDRVSDSLPPAVSVPLLKKIKEKTNVFSSGTSNASAEKLRPIPADFWPTTLEVSWAIRECPGVDITAATKAFKAHNSASGQVWPDASRAWRGWMTNAARLAQQRSAAGRAVVRRRGEVTPMPPPVSAHLAQLCRREDGASEATRSRLVRGWRDLAPPPITT